MMILSVFLAPFLHGQTGPLDEVELCLAPIIVVISVLAYRVFRHRASRRYDRTLKRQRRRSAEKDD